MKSFSLSNAKWLIAPLITLALIGAMWSYYSLIYVPNRVEYFTGRNLRILATIGNEITSVIRNYNQVLLRTEPLEYAITHTFVRSGTGTSWAITYTPTDSGTPIKQKDVQDVIHKLVALLLCLASTGCTVATGNRDVASKAARDRIHPGMTKAEVSGIMGKPALTIDREGKPDRWAYGYAEMKWKPWPFAKRDEPEFLLSGLEVSFSRKGTVTGVDACRVCSEPECK